MKHPLTLPRLAALASAFLIPFSHAELSGGEKEETAKKGSFEWIQENEDTLLGTKVTVKACGWDSKSPEGAPLNSDKEQGFVQTKVYDGDDVEGTIFLRFDYRDQDKLKRKYTGKKGGEADPERLSGTLKKLPGGDLFIDISKLEKDKDFVGEASDKKEEDKDVKDGKDSGKEESEMKEKKE